MTIYVPNSLAEEQETILLELRNGAAKYGITVDTREGSADWLWARAYAQPSLLQYEDIKLLSREIHPETCSEAVLIQWCRRLGLPEITAVGGSGRLKVSVQGITTIPAGQSFQIGTASGRVLTTYTGIGNGAEVDVQMDGVGEATNFPAGSRARFANPPRNLQEFAVVSSIRPIKDGVSTESVGRRRERVMLRLGYSAGGGNPGQLMSLARQIPIVQGAFVYSALGGPSTEKVVVAKAFDRANADFSRVVPDAGLRAIRRVIHAELGHSLQVMIGSVADQPTDIALGVTLPKAAISGGDGNGWIDPVVWPPTPTNGVAITSVPESRVIIVNAATSQSPVAGRTNVAWWSPATKEFVRGVVQNVSGSSGAWVLTLGAPLVDSRGGSPQVGDWISPAAARLDDYASAWLDGFERLGPGENTALSALLPRSLRIPSQVEGPRSDVYLPRFTRLAAQTEIEERAIIAASLLAPTVPASHNLPPNVLVPRHFGVYPL